MSDDIVGISKSEAENAINTIKQQSELAKEAIKKVQNSPSLLPNWRGHSKKMWEQNIIDDMTRLIQASEMIDVAAQKINVALVNFLRADGINV